MNVYAPQYYAQFHCLADRCRHTCCAGWEIDIDEESLARYRAMSGAFGQRLNAAISLEDTPHFQLDADERCPMLNRDNLCDLIIACGEGALCQICADHPRFRSFWSDREELGLGMVCEAAARLILTQTEPMQLVRIAGDGCEALDEAERWLMDVRAQMLSEIRETGPRARLREYLIYRHIADALYDDRLEERAAFIDQACAAITRGWQEGDIDDLVERCRRFSDTVEYDDEVLEGFLSGRQSFHE